MKVLNLEFRYKISLIFLNENLCIFAIFAAKNNLQQCSIYSQFTLKYIKDLCTWDAPCVIKVIDYENI